MPNIAYMSEHRAGCWVRVAQCVVFMVHFADLLWLLWHIMEFSETMQMGQLFAVLCEHGYKLPHFTLLLCAPNLGCSQRVPRVKLYPGLLPFSVLYLTVNKELYFFCYCSISTSCWWGPVYVNVTTDLERCCWLRVKSPDASSYPALILPGSSCFEHSVYKPQTCAGNSFQVHNLDNV